MNNLANCLAVAVVLAHGLCIAQSAPFSSVYDDASRVRRVEFKDNLVIGVVGYGDRPIVLELDPSEPIIAAAGGVISGWEISKVENRLFVRPLAEARPATVVLGTRTRSYILDLSPGSAKKIPSDFVSKIVVTYPVPPPPPPPVVVVDPAIEINRLKYVAAAEVVRLKDAATPLSEAFESGRNMAYSIEIVSEQEDIRPREVFDDGRFTFFKFPDNLPIPAIYKTTPNTKEEWLVNSHRDGEYTVLHSVAPAWNLRLAGSMLGIFNDAFDATGIAPKNNSS